jgi:hypothetical protein
MDDYLELARLSQEYASLKSQVEAKKAELNAVVARIARGPDSPVSGQTPIPAKPQRSTLVRRDSAGPRRRGKVNDARRALAALADIERGTLQDVLQHLNSLGTTIPRESVRAYLGRAVRVGKAQRPEGTRGVYEALPGAERSQDLAAGGVANVTEGASMSTREALWRVLAQADHPMRVAELLDPLERLRGVPYTHKRRTSPVWAAIANCKEDFVSRSGLVGLTEWPLDKWPEDARGQ